MPPLADRHAEPDPPLAEAASPEPESPPYQPEPLSAQPDAPAPNETLEPLPTPHDPPPPERPSFHDESESRPRLRAPRGERGGNALLGWVYVAGFMVLVALGLLALLVPDTPSDTEARPSITTAEQAVEPPPSPGDDQPPSDAPLGDLDEDLPPPPSTQATPAAPPSAADRNGAAAAAGARPAPAAQARPATSTPPRAQTTPPPPPRIQQNPPPPPPLQRTQPQATQPAQPPPLTQQRRAVQPATPPATTPAPRPPPVQNLGFISNPQWTRTPSRRAVADAYPARALEDEVEGTVVLRCAVLSGGRLQCRVQSESRRGWGFGDAALNVATGYRTEEYERNGNLAVGRELELTVRFELED